MIARSGRWLPISLILGRFCRIRRVKPSRVSCAGNGLSCRGPAFARSLPRGESVLMPIFVSIPPDAFVKEPLSRCFPPPNLLRERRVNLSACDFGTIKSWSSRSPRG